MKAAIRVLTHNRKDRVRHCLPSIAAGMRRGVDELYVIDDQSTEYDVEYLKTLVPQATSIFRTARKSDHDMESLRRWDLTWFLHDSDADMLCCVDSDALCHRWWLREAKHLMRQYGHPVSMFNPALHHADYTIGEYKGAILRTLGQGVCFCFSRAHVETVLHKTTEEEMNSAGWDWVASRALGKICVANPSLVEHLGWGGAHSRDYTAENFGDFAMNLEPDMIPWRNRVIEAIKEGR